MRREWRRDSASALAFLPRGIQCRRTSPSCTDQPPRLRRMRREHGRPRALLHVVDDDPAVAIDHESSPLRDQRGFEHRNQREIFGLAAVAVPRRRADFERRRRAGSSATRRCRSVPDSDAPSRRTRRAMRPAHDDGRDAPQRAARATSRTPSTLRAPAHSPDAARAPIRRATARRPPFRAFSRARRARKSMRPSTNGGSTSAPSYTRWTAILIEIEHEDAHAAGWG